MARLNEPPLPVENVEAVKRRFIRQNRELAKHNSAQSMRIRQLETQASQLLSENISLRDQVGELRGQLEGRPQRHGVALDIVSSVKSRLEEKMQDIALLVAELGDSTRQTASTMKRKTANTSSLKEWQNAAAAAMAEAGPQYRLETIREDKPFPRRTMNAEEIRDIVNASESPDIGPPPVAHFNEIDPVKFDPPAPRNEEAESQEQDADALTAPFSVNLETRRKRKDGQTRLDIRRLSVFQSPPGEKTESTDEEVPQTQALPIRAGAKRKMSAREADDKPASTSALAQNESFEFSRRTVSARSSDTPKPSERRSVKISDRKALGAKSANVDISNSPKKAGKEKPEKPDKECDDVAELNTALSATKLEDRRSREQKSRPANRPAVDELIHVSETPAPPPVVDIVLQPASLPPKTPAAADMLSPTSTETSATGPQDTPEPNNTLGEISGASRPGRRARAQVNYAEPSLNAKMRRPGKELADAVSGQGKPVAVRAQPRFKKDPDESATSGEDWKKLPVALSSTQDHDVAMIGEPNSPLRDKALSLSQALRDQKEKDKLEATRDVEREAAQSIGEPAASDPSGPAALTSAMRKRLGRPAQVLPATISDAKIDGLTEETRESLAVFDFTESSPQDSVPKISDKASRAQSSRRHSSVPSLPLSSELEKGPVDNLPRSKVGRELSAAARSSTATPTAVDSITAARRERAASRRRSMML